MKQARQFGLRKGDHLTGASRPANRSEKNPALLRIDTVNDGNPEDNKGRPHFEDLTPLFPDEKLDSSSGKRKFYTTNQPVVTSSVNSELS